MANLHPMFRAFSATLRPTVSSTIPTEPALCACNGAPAGNVLPNGEELSANVAIALRNDGSVAGGTVLYGTDDAGTTWSPLLAAAVSDFGAGGLKTDAIVESTGDAGVTLEAFKFENETTSRTITTSNVPVVWTHTANGAADDLTIAVAGATDSSLVLSSTGTGSDAVQLTASVGGMDIGAAGDLDITGTTTADFGDAVAKVHMDGAGAITLTGATTVDIDGSGAITVNSSGSTIGIGTDAVAQAINIGTGAAARVITIGNAASASLALEAGVGGVDMNADTTIDIDAGGALTIDSSAGAISIGADAVAQAVNIATGAAARVITVGNAASASLKLEAGVGGLDVDADTTIEIDAGGAVTIESSAGAISIGADAVAQAINIGTAGARAITIGSAAAAGVDIDAGVDDLNLLADDDITITAGLTSTWSITGNDAGNLTLTIDSINAGAGNGLVVVTADNDVTLGDAVGNPTLTLAGTGALTMATSKRLVNAAAETLSADDDVLLIVDPADPTKIARVDAGNITAGQTRVLTMADNDVDLAHAVLEATGTIATADVKTMNATPVQVIAAPAVGKYIEVLSCEWFLDWNSAAYDAAGAGDTLNLKYTNGAGVAVVTPVPGDTIGAAGADYHTLVHALAGPLIPAVAAAIVAHIATGEWFAAAGDSPLKYRILYRIRTLAT